MKSIRSLVRALGVLAMASIIAGCSPPQVTSEPLAEASPSNPPPTSTTPPSTPTAPPPTKVPPPPSATAPEPYAVVMEAEQLIGTWMGSESDFTRFYEDGTYREATSLTLLDDAPFAISKYEFEAGRFITREVSVSGVPSCGGKVGSYEIRLLQSGNLQIVLIIELLRGQSRRYDRLL